MTIEQLKRRAKKFGMTIRKYDRREDSELRLDDLDNQHDDDD